MTERKTHLRELLKQNIVTLIFVTLSLLCLAISGMQVSSLIKELITRIARNGFLVLSLIIPVIAGIGLNFGIVVGAMAAQTAIIIVTLLGWTGFPSLLACFVISTPFAILFGWLTGKIFNMAKGQEMITGMMLGNLANGLYQLVFIVLIGSAFIPVVNSTIMLSTGVGLKNSIDLAPTIKYGLDGLIQIPTSIGLVVVGVLGIGLNVYRMAKAKKQGKPIFKEILFACLFAGLAVVALLPSVSSGLANNSIPVVTMLVIAALYVANGLFLKTRLGQNMRTVGNSMGVANASGLNVNRIRIIAVIISTVLAAWGQIINLQNIGTLQTFGSHENVGLYSIAAILVGGASVKRATNSQALLGTILFHALFIVSPQAGQVIFNDPQLGEYFRVFIAYGVIAVALALHAWEQTKSMMASRKARQASQGAPPVPPVPPAGGEAGADGVSTA